jgi:hypothetical protein
MGLRAAVIGLVILSMSASVASAVAIGQVDTFAASLAGWRVGDPHPNPPAWVPNGGPLGPGDNFMRVEGFGGDGPGSKPNVFNASRWQGDYLAAGVTAIELDVRHLGEGPETMQLRIGLQAADLFAWSLLSVPVGPGTPQPWQENVIFPIDPANLGGDDPVAVLSNVEKLWLYHGPTGEERKTSALDVRIGYDNIRAVPEPGTLALLGSACLVLLVWGWRRRRSA